MTAVLSLEVYQQQQADAVYRAQVHAAVDVLLDDLEVQMADSTEDLPSLFTLTEAVRAERSRLSGTIVQAYVERTYEPYLHQERADGPQCGRSLKARPSRPRTVETMVGSVRVDPVPVPIVVGVGMVSIRWMKRWDCPFMSNRRISRKRLANGP